MEELRRFSLLQTQCHGFRPAKSGTLTSTLERVQGSLNASVYVAPSCPSCFPVGGLTPWPDAENNRLPVRKGKCGTGERAPPGSGELGATPGISSLKLWQRYYHSLTSVSSTIHTAGLCLCSLRPLPGACTQFLHSGTLEEKIEPQCSELSGQVVSEEL